MSQYEGLSDLAAPVLAQEYHYGQSPSSSSAEEVYPPMAPKKGRKSLKRTHLLLEDSRAEDPAFELGPDLAIYFDAFDLDDAVRVSLCRSYASYLSSKTRAVAQRE